MSFEQPIGSDVATVAMTQEGVDTSCKEMDHAGLIYFLSRQPELATFNLQEDRSIVK